MNRTRCLNPLAFLTKPSMPASTSSTLLKCLISPFYIVLSNSILSTFNSLTFSVLRYPVPQRAETQGRSEEYLGRWIKRRKIPRDRIVLATKVAGPSGQMTWIRGGPKCLDSRNITDAIDSRFVGFKF